MERNQPDERLSPPESAVRPAAIDAAGSLPAGARLPSKPNPNPEGLSEAASLASDVSSLWRFIVINNPFYLISAFLVIYGLHLRFNVDADAYNPWTLMLALCGYIVLLAGTAYAVVRFGKVWEDARSILLVLVLLLMWLSVSFDRFVVESRTDGGLVLTAGFLLSVLVSRGLLTGLGIRLPTPFSVPYFGLLGLLFLYPLALGELVRQKQWEALNWGIYLFSPLAALGILALLPAVNRGSELVRNNGTPWRWPWFPWTLFVLLAAGICGRCWWLSISFGPVRKMYTTFGPYFLVPILLSVVVVFLQLAWVSGSRFYQKLALWLAAGLMLPAIQGKPPSSEYAEFLGA